MIIFSVPKGSFISPWTRGTRRTACLHRIWISLPKLPPKWRQTKHKMGKKNKLFDQRNVCHRCNVWPRTFATKNWIMSRTLSSISSSICEWNCFCKEKSSMKGISLYCTTLWHCQTQMKSQLVEFVSQVINDVMCLQQQFSYQITAFKKKKNS